MAYWNGRRWIAGDALAREPASAHVARWAATVLMLIGLLALVIPLRMALAGKTAPGCALSGLELGGAAVVQVNGWGMRHSADYVLRWTEPQITQVQYWWSTSRGTLQQTVLNNQGSGTYSVALFYRGPKGEVWDASCSMGV